MKENALKLARLWSENTYFDESDRNELAEKLAEYDRYENEITESFYQDLEFGTGGLRSIIGFGSNRMNKYNIRKATQAMCNIVLKDTSKKHTACVSYDCRRFSPEFAKEVASVFAANGINCFIYQTLMPTPMLSYAVRHYDSSCGVMLTASHNPKQYNGFKAYWNDGAQVTPPHDQMIIDEYNNLQDWNQIKCGDFEKQLTDGSIKWIDEKCIEDFYKITEQHALNPAMCKESGDKVHFVYTPLHGTGYIPCKTISERLGFSRFEIVESQAVFDSEFSTVRTTPNPEDPAALEMAVAIMKEANADVAYGTDPDGDRLGVVVNNKGIEHYLNGNQIAILMLHYIFSQRSANKTLPNNPLVIKSIVTSPMQRTIVEKFGGTVLDTLTGFKWMAKLWRELEESNTDYNFVFASEESFGYMPHNQVRDKDAVASIALMNEVTLFHKLNGKNLIEALDSIYEEFGYAEESLIALTFEGLAGKDKINNIMKYFRDNNTAEIAGNKIAKFTDYKTLKEHDLIEGTEKDVAMTASNVLGFVFENGNQLFLRPSGTEPKIKFYTMVQVKDGDLTTKKSTAKTLISEVESFIHQAIKDL